MAAKNSLNRSAIGLLVVAAAFIIAVALSNLVFRGFRLDLTENGLYTLSDGTKTILSSIPEREPLT